MRYILFLSIFFVLLSCNKDDREISETTNEDTYKIKKIQFSLTDGNIDSLFTKLDTINYINASNEKRPDTTIYPYRALKDSLKIIMDTSEFDNLVFKDSIGFRPMEINKKKEIRKFSEDSIYISRLPDNFTFPVRNVLESASFEPNAQTKYAITGEYWRVKYDIKFEAEIECSNNDKPIVVTGVMKYSIVRTNDPNRDEHLKTIIIVASKI